MAMRVGLCAVHCILHYIKCPPHKWSLFIAFLTLGFPGGSEAKNLPATQETGVQSLVRKIAWGREWQPTPGFLPGEFHGQRSLETYSPWGCKESNMTECFLPYFILFTYLIYLFSYLTFLPYFINSFSHPLKISSPLWIQRYTWE